MKRLRTILDMTRKGAQGFPMETIQAQLRASQAMELNLRTGRIKVGMVVGRNKQIRVRDLPVLTRFHPPIATSTPWV